MAHDAAGLFHQDAARHRSPHLTAAPPCGIAAFDPADAVCSLIPTWSDSVVARVALRPGIETASSTERSISMRAA